MQPRVLISDALSPAAVADLQGSRRHGRVSARSRQGQGEACRDDQRLRRARHPLGDQGNGENPRTGEEPQGDRTRRHRRRQCRHTGGDRARHHRDEHAVRQLDHDRRARDHAHAVAGTANSRSRRVDARRQMGEEQVSRRRDVRKDPRHHRLRQHRLDRRRSRDRAEDEGDRLRSVPVGRARSRSRGGKGRARAAAAPRGLRHPAYPAH